MVSLSRRCANHACENATNLEYTEIRLRVIYNLPYFQLFGSRHNTGNIEKVHKLNTEKTARMRFFPRNYFFFLVVFLAAFFGAFLAAFLTAFLATFLTAFFAAFLAFFIAIFISPIGVN